MKQDYKELCKVLENKEKSIQALIITCNEYRVEIKCLEKKIERLRNPKKELSYEIIEEILCRYGFEVVGNTLCGVRYKYEDLSLIVEIQIIEDIQVYQFRIITPSDIFVENAIPFSLKTVQDLHSLMRFLKYKKL